MCNESDSQRFYDEEEEKRFEEILGLIGYERDSSTLEDDSTITWRQTQQDVNEHFSPWGISISWRLTSSRQIRCDVKFPIEGQYLSCSVIYEDDPFPMALGRIVRDIERAVENEYNKRYRKDPT